MALKDKVVIHLTDDQRTTLRRIVHTGIHPQPCVDGLISCSTGGNRLFPSTPGPQPVDHEAHGRSARRVGSGDVD